MKEFSKLEIDDYSYIVSELSEELFQLNGKTVLLLGGSGFLGTSFKRFILFLNEYVPLFQLTPCRIISVDNYIKGTISFGEEPVNINLINLYHDITVPIDEKLHGYQIDYIINASGNASPTQYLKYPYETISVSFNGVRNILEFAQKIKAKVLSFSSSEVLGTPPNEEIPTPEESPCRLTTLNHRASYDVSKAMIETLSFLAREAGTDCKVIRPFNVIGYFNKNDYRVIPNFFKKIKNGNKIEVFSPGTQTRTFCFYSDFIIGCFKVLLNSKDILYHIGNSDNEISMLDLAKKIAKLYRRDNLVSLIETPTVYKTEPLRRCPNIKKAKIELGYSPNIGLDLMLNKIKKYVDLNY